MFIKVLITFVLITIFNNCKVTNATELPHVYCNKFFILVELPVTSNHSYEFFNKVYWENVPVNSAKECQPRYQENGITMEILIDNLNKCGFVRSINKLKHHVSYYQNLVIKQKHNITTKIPIKCSYQYKTPSFKTKHKIVKRDTLPEDFEEETDLEILETIEQKAPEPEVLMEVRQNGDLINGMVTVIPGTPLVMEIKLKENAQNIYGLKVNFMEVTDTIDTSETILYKGCTVDPYLFENFNLTDSNTLKSKFRAFKFPNTAFVQFKANVQICLKSCIQTQCIGSSNQQTRRRRELIQTQDDFYEVDTRFTLKLNETSKGLNRDDLQKLQNHVQMLLDKSKNNLLHNMKNL